MVQGLIRCSVTLVCCLACGLAAPACRSVPAAAAPVEHPLVAKAKEVVCRRCLIPGRIEHVMTELDRGGLPQCSNRAVTTLTKDPSGCVHTTARDEVSAVRNGDGLPRCTAEPGSTSLGDVFVPLNCFCRLLERRDATFRVTPTNDTREVAGRTCQIFDFEAAAGKAGTVNGTVCLEPETGSPLEARFAPGKLPRHRALESTIIRFADDGPLGWRPVTVESEVREDATRGHESWIRVRIALEDHWSPDASVTGMCKEAAGPAPAPALEPIR